MKLAIFVVLIYKTQIPCEKNLQAVNRINEINVRNNTQRWHPSRTSTGLYIKATPERVTDSVKKGI